MKILGIETSCDDTGIAVVEGQGKTWPSFRILSSVVASQVKLHQKYGGVYPNLAKREHAVNLPIALEQALAGAGTVPARARAGTVPAKPAINAIAVTYGPGLSPCLWQGINFAKELAKKWKVPLMPADHMEGHLLVGLFSQSDENFQFPISNFQTNSKSQNPKPKNIFPAIVLLVSGGHTQLFLMRRIGEYQLLGETRDDAAGEAFDKTARILGLPYPGGPAIAAAAAQIPKHKTQIPNKSQNSNSKFQIKLPRPMLHSKDCDFSFSGLKTAVLYDYQARAKKETHSKEYIQAMAKEIQQAIIDVLVAKTLKAANTVGAKSIILGGGVSANRELRSQFELKVKSEKSKVNLFLPPPKLATDNGIMPALAGYFLFLKRAYPKNPDSIAANPNVQLS